MAKTKLTYIVNLQVVCSDHSQAIKLQTKINTLLATFKFPEGDVEAQIETLS